MNKNQLTPPPIHGRAEQTNKNSRKSRTKGRIRRTKMETLGSTSNRQCGEHLVNSNGLSNSPLRPSHSRQRGFPWCPTALLNRCLTFLTPSSSRGLHCNMKRHPERSIHQPLCKEPTPASCGLASSMFFPEICNFPDPVTLVFWISEKPAPGSFCP